MITCFYLSIVSVFQVIGLPSAIQWKGPCMVILHIVDHFSLGGAQRIVEGIVKHMSDTLLLPLRKKGSDDKQIGIEDSRFLQKPSSSLLHQILNLLQVPAQIKEQDIQIVHCHLHFSWLYGLWLYFWMPSGSRPKFFFHEHDSVEIFRWFYPIWVRLLSRKGIFIAVSHFIQQHLLSCGVPEEKIVLLKNFVDLERFYPGGRCELSTFGLETRIAKDTRIIGFAGRLVEYKGWRVILEIAHALPEACFLIAGDGPDADKLVKEIRAQELEDRVFFLGYVENMRGYYHSIDLLVIPSVKEAFGLVQLEAQACGVPVLVYDNQAAQEIHGDHSTILVRSGDIEMLIHKVNELLNSSELIKSLVEKGLENARAYNLPTYILTLDRFYHKILNQ